MAPQIEDAILEQLTSRSVEELLSGDEVVQTLEASKKTSAVIEARVEEAAHTQAQISQIRVAYEPVAQRAALLYFCVRDMTAIDPMYQVRCRRD